MLRRVAAKKLPRASQAVSTLRHYTPPPPPPAEAVAAAAEEYPEVPGKHKCGSCAQPKGCNVADVVGKCIPLPKPFHPHELKSRAPLTRVKGKRLITDGNGAASYVGYAMSETMFIYPITPSSVMAENADAWAVAGRKNVFNRVPTIAEMQSEAGAAAAVHGALVAGGFACSFTSSQGLLLMLPNMFQMAGQLLPTVLHVASRSISGSTTSICGDHSDVMAVRTAGFAFLSSHSVQEAHDLAVIAHISSLKTSIPFIHFFEGFEISHQVTNIEVLPYEEIAKLLPAEAVRRHRDRALNPHHPKRLNSSTGRDVVFQVTEAVNMYYRDAAAAVQETMDEFAELTGRQYHLFEYYGSPDAESVVVIMGSGSRSVEFAVDHLRKQGEKVGVLKVHLFRPWGMEQFMEVLPKTVRKVAVLDRVKECGALAEPLFLDVASTLQQHNINLDLITGGRYGVSEKGFNAAMAVSVFENLKQPKPKTRFTVGIVDDVTHLSLPLPPVPIQVQAPETRQCIFWGMGGDGTVGANKQAIDIICSNTDHNASAQFFYTPHKSGAITTSHVRFGAEQFESQPITTATYVASHHPSYVHKFDLLKPLVKGGTFVLNTAQSKEDLMKALPARLKKQMGEKEIGFYIIDANKVAKDAGLGENINMIMQAVFFKLLGMFSPEQSLQYVKDSIVKTFGKKKDKAVVERNIKGVENALAYLVHVDFPVKEWAAIDLDGNAAKAELPLFVTGIQQAMLSQQGSSLPVSAFNPDGATPPTTARFEKRAKAPLIAAWDPENCSQCNLCAFVCPHSCIRPFLLTPEDMKGAPKGMPTLQSKDGGRSMKYRLQVSPMDCTGCEVCVRVCPENSLSMVPSLPKIEAERKTWDYLEAMPQKQSTVDKWTVRGSQMQKPLLEFSGACDGCSQTTYIKVMTQLFGSRMIIANATGCSSVWGSLFATNPYTTNSEGRGPAYARSLFEDAAEFGFGMYEATNRRRADLAGHVTSALASPDATMNPELRKALEGWLAKMDDPQESDNSARVILPLLDAETHPLLRPIQDGRDLFIKPSQWVLGGDGWAHDIGFAGLDHILAQSHSDINVFVMDNEVYSNTGGQASKSTPIGAVAKMAAGGKRMHKKDLGMMAMLYGHVYVAQVSISHPEHFLKVLKEAESYRGPSLVMAYCPCRDHSVDLGDMVSLCKEAVDSGYYPLYRFDPRLSQSFQMDSDIRQDVLPFLQRQGRYRILQTKNPETAKKLFADMQAEINRRHKMQVLLADPTSAHSTHEPTAPEPEVAAPEPVATPPPPPPPPPAPEAPKPAAPKPATPAPAAPTPTPGAPAPGGPTGMHRAARHAEVGQRVPWNLVAEEPPAGRKVVTFNFNGKPMQGYEGEMVSSALIAAGEEVFGHHHKDGSPQGIFCANGQCSACQVVINGAAAKSCMTAVRAGLAVESGLPQALEREDEADILPPGAIAEPREVSCLIIGGGPAGLSAAYELAKLGEKVLIVDDKDRLGGKLVLQTHKFFGTVEDTRAGTRGFDIAKQLGEELKAFQNVEVQLETTAVGVFSDQVIGLRHYKEETYELIKPKHLLVATGARERMMPFPGNTLPGVYGAGAFQTLVNRDWVRPAKRVLIIGGGNVGLIAGYHAIQAGMHVVALVEGADSCKGYKVHADKLMRLGVPIKTRHTILAAHGKDHVHSATIAQVDESFNPIPGTEQEYEVDCVLVAVGLAEVNEFVKKAQKFGIPTYSAGDSQEVAEASAAMLTGRIAGLRIAKALGHEPEEDFNSLKAKAELLRQPGGSVHEQVNELPERGVRPIMHCWQEIPCNACKPACQYSLIKMDNVMALPHFNTKSTIECSACNKCVAACPGLALTVVDTRKDPKNPLVSFPFEIDTGDVQVGKKVMVVGDKGEPLGEHPIVAMEHNEEYNTYLVTVQVPRKIALQAAAIWQQPAQAGATANATSEADPSCAYVCRCERVSISDIKSVAEASGCADVNQIKAITRQGMGACGGKNCGPLSQRILQQMGLAKEGQEVTPSVDRPLFVEIPLKELARAPTPPAPKSAVPVLQHVRDRETNSFDVIVLGAGSVGVPLTMALAAAGKRVICLDRGASPGQGDNKRAIGGIRQTFGQPSKISVMRRSLEMFRNWRQDFGEDIGWQQHGYIFPVYREADEEMLKGLMEVQHKHGLNIKWLSAGKMAELIPGINPKGLRGGTFSPEDGNAAPFLAVNSMQQRAVHLGANFRFHESVASISRQVNGAVSGVLTHGQDKKPAYYYAPVIINALGASTNAVLHSVGRELSLDPDSHEAGVTEAVQRFFSGLVVDLRPMPGSKNFYFYQNEHGQLVFCITPDPPISGYDESETSQFLPQVSKRLIELLPRLGSVSVRRTWRGLYSNTTDGLPMVGWDRDIPGLLHATGMGGHGFMLGPGLGEVVARLVCDKLTDEDKMILDAWNPMREFKGDEQLR